MRRWSSFLVILSAFGLMLMSSCVRNRLPEPSGTELVIPVAGVKGFDAIESTGTYQIELIRSDVDSVVIMVDSMYQSYVDVHLKGKKLMMGCKVSRMRKNFTVFAKVFYTGLESVELSGASRLHIDSILRCARMEVSLSGASAMEGRMVVSGNLEMDISGCSLFEGDCTVGGKSDVTVSGASSLKWKGYIKEAELAASGASMVEGFEMAIDDLDADVSGASKMKVMVNSKLSATASGASHLIYDGEPDVTAKTSGASSVSAR